METILRYPLLSQTDLEQKASCQNADYTSNEEMKESNLVVGQLKISETKY